MDFNSQIQNSNVGTNIFRKVGSFNKSGGCKILSYVICKGGIIYVMEC